MKKTTIAATLFLVIGFQAFAYGGFTMLMDSNKSAAAQAAKSKQGKLDVRLGLYGGAAGMLLGGMILLLGRRKKEEND